MHFCALFTDLCNFEEQKNGVLVLFFEILGRCNLRINRQQGVYDNGRALPQIYRERILDLYHQGFSQRDISETTRVSVGYINKVVHNYEDNNTSLPPTKTTPARNVFTQDVVDYIESEKLCKPSIYTSEIQQRLLLDGVVPPHHLPSQSGIKKCVRDDCHMTKKKITQVATESLSEANVHYTDYFLGRISQLDCITL